MVTWGLVAGSYLRVSEERQSVIGSGSGQLKKFRQGTKKGVTVRGIVSELGANWCEKVMMTERLA
jgi:hypothetical protein